jgi:hypothetical protein
MKGEHGPWNGKRLVGDYTDGIISMQSILERGHVEIANVPTEARGKGEPPVMHDGLLTNGYRSIAEWTIDDHRTSRGRILVCYIIGIVEKLHITRKVFRE